MKKIITISIILLIISFIVIWGFGRPLCETETFNRAKSPGYNFTAIHQMVDCGATTNHSTSVFIDKKCL